MSVFWKSAQLSHPCHLGLWTRTCHACNGPLWLSEIWAAITLFSIIGLLTFTVIARIVPTSSLVSGWCTSGFFGSKWDIWLYVFVIFCELLLTTWDLQPTCRSSVTNSSSPACCTRVPYSSTITPLTGALSQVICPLYKMILRSMNSECDTM